MPPWLTTLSLMSLFVAGLCTLAIAANVLIHPQKMWIMNLVWPLTALYGGPLALLFYWKVGRFATKDAVTWADSRAQRQPREEKPFWQAVAIGATHCGSGCVLGDLVAEWVTVAAPLIIFGHKIFGGWIIDYLCAYLIGILFQYFSIKPMKKLSPSEGVWAAIKADTLSLTAWQVGMYGWMAIATFLVFGHEISKLSPVFWFMMQIAMVCGFCTAYPANWWLIRHGLKEAM